jgi:SAM-dependent methyltransferase
MHIEAFEGIKERFEKYGKGHTLDVGSLQVKDRHLTFREFCPDYVGTDILPGKNVDVVCTEVLPFENESFDTVISGNCFEHCENPFALILECARVLKPGGYFIGTAPRNWPDHHRPDCWRILPDGWVALFKYAKLSVVETAAIPHATGRNSDCYGVAKK